MAALTAGALIVAILQAILANDANKFVKRDDEVRRLSHLLDQSREERSALETELQLSEAQTAKANLQNSIDAESSKNRGAKQSIAIADLEKEIAEQKLLIGALIDGELELPASSGAVEARFEEPVRIIDGADANLQMLNDELQLIIGNQTIPPSIGEIATVRTKNSVCIVEVIEDDTTLPQQSKLAVPPIRVIVNYSCWTLRPAH